MSRSRARFHYILPDVTSSSDEQDAALTRHFSLKNSGDYSKLGAAEGD